MMLDRGPGLVEAASYIQQFRDRLVVVKLGGELLEDSPVLERLLPQVAVMVQVGLRPILVHGGGKQIDRACTERGIQPVKHRGRRVTDDGTLRVLLEVVGGELNRAVVSRLRKLEIDAFGFEEGAGDAIVCTRRAPTVEDGSTVDWGHVGDVVRIDAARLMPEPGTPWRVPVLPSLGMLVDGGRVNVNADAVASKVASDLGAVKLVLMTAVDGVMEHMSDAGPISELTAAEARGLIDGQVVVGGMRAKLEEALRAIANGVPRVHILTGRDPMTLLREIFTDEGCGTLIVPQ